MTKNEYVITVKRESYLATLEASRGRYAVL
jgi:hypothetical protein